ncbi:MAG: alpha/beta fold hydrolase [Dehalococcoidia bacterium]
MGIGRSLTVGSLAVMGAMGSAWAYTRWLTRRNEQVDPALLARPGDMIYIDGIGIHYMERGHGWPLVLIHGLGGSTYNFRHNIPALAEHFRVLAPDLMGFGFSDRPPDADYSLTSQAQLVRNFMARLGVQQASVLGLSMGGTVAMRLAANFPERVERLVLAASAGGGRLVPAWAGSFLARPLVEAFVAFALHNRTFREALWRTGSYDPTVLTPEVKEGYYRPGRIRGSARAVAKVMADLAREEPLDLSRIYQPTLLLWGADDRWLRLSLAQQLLQALPNAELQIIDQARHMVLEERAEEANRAAISFLLRRTPSP